MIAWLRDAAERALKTAAQTAVALLAADGTSVLTLAWGQAAAVVATATAVSVLTSVASVRLGDPGTASAVHTGPAPDIVGQVAAQAEMVVPVLVREAADRIVPDLVGVAASQLREQLDDALSRGLSVEEISRRIGGPR